ncbi:polymerase [Acinetobacter sp. NCu2D-2]|uniref:PglL family O-oligosaccharyltransferase n=1 Tax=Acinetobacter sp. NCu2D-2 TaxID=1608473 RepID=UPI0007CDBA88|nr:O-antigen ligase family protein [Acinetobacter sp. NCu2D-2]ANF82665.1 polymerase [Acinetobacter sp. NCu2D-2]
MKTVLALIAAFLISLAWLSPVHYRPWVTYTGELYAFIALIALAAICFKDKLTIPKVSLPLIALATVPIFKYFLDQVFFSSIALMGCLYILSFWLALILGRQLSAEQYSREQTFTYLSQTFAISGVLTGLIALCQWSNLDAIIPGVMNISGTTRPFANFAQPNNMATFLLMALMATLYLYEKNKLRTVWLVPAALIMIMGLALSQSRTAWVAAIAIVCYLSFYQYKSVIRLKWFYSLLWLGLFIGFIWLFPILSQLAVQAMDAEVIRSRSVVSRATGDMSRLAIWQQMIAAIEARPWFGYGWYQTSTAFTSISETVQGPVWVRSAHNFILDFILWNGVIVGVPFLAYFGYLAYRLQKWVNSPESVIGILMIGAFITHTMFEFPQNYAYFLLPVGFIIGTILAQEKDLKVITLNAIWSKLIVVIAIILTCVIVRDYDVAVAKIGESMRYEKQPEKIQNQQPIYLLSELNHRIEWICLNPLSKVDPSIIQEGEHLVLSYPTRYNLMKYAKLLAYNGYEQEAYHQLLRLKLIQKVDLSYEELLEMIAE